MLRLDWATIVLLGEGPNAIVHLGALFRNNAHISDDVAIVRVAPVVRCTASLKQSS